MGKTIQAAEETEQRTVPGQGILSSAGFPGPMIGWNLCVLFPGKGWPISSLAALTLNLCAPPPTLRRGQTLFKT